MFFGSHGQFVEILAGLPDGVQRLIVKHVPDENNRCRGRTRPSTGRPERRAPAAPNEPWPCPLRKLAEHARRLQSGAMQHGPNETSP